MKVKHAEAIDLTTVTVLEVKRKMVEYEIKPILDTMINLTYVGQITVSGESSYAWQIVGCSDLYFFINLTPSGAGAIKYGFCTSSTILSSTSVGSGGTSGQLRHAEVDFYYIVTNNKLIGFGFCNINNTLPNLKVIDTDNVPIYAYWDNSNVYIDGGTKYTIYSYDPTYSDPGKVLFKRAIIVNSGAYISKCANLYKIVNDNFSSFSNAWIDVDGTQYRQANSTYVFTINGEQ